jgi:hypothetical protein
MRFPNCPRCKSPVDKKLHRNFFVKYFIPWLRLRHYHCKTCERGYYIREPNR